MTTTSTTPSPELPPSSYGHAKGELLTSTQWVTLAYGVRARVTDLQVMERDRIGGIGRSQIAEAQRAVTELDSTLLAHARQSPAVGAAIFEQIKSTRLGSLQHLSQRLKEVIAESESSL